ncbi:hypothetical protein [Angustibacter aerolatus]
MVTPDYARAYIDELHRLAPAAARSTASTTEVREPRGLARLVRALSR